MPKVYIVGAAVALAALWSFVSEPTARSFAVADPYEDTAAFPAPPYKSEPISAPTLHGTLLKLLATFFELPVVGSVLVADVIVKNDYRRLKDFAASIPNARALYAPYKPVTSSDIATAQDVAQKARVLLPKEMDPLVAALGAPFELDDSDILRCYYHPYRQRTTTPSEVLEKTLAAIERSESGPIPLRAVVVVDRHGALKAAEASTERYRRGAPLSVMDGVPVTVKIELAVAGLPQTFGVAFRDGERSSFDSPAVRKLRDAGAIIVGVTNMHEIGIGITGFNAHYGSARNPHNLAHHTGGSSSGSAAAVAAGLVPVALGVDGGGSIRIPSSFCGLVGIKGTFGRVPAEGGGVAWTVGHVGPITRTVSDAAIALSIIAPCDASDDAQGLCYPQPPLHFSNFSSPSLRGLRIGVARDFNNDAQADQRKACRKAEERLKSLGAEVVDIELPYLDIAFRAHTVSILSEMLTAVARFGANRTLFSYPTRATLAIARGLGPDDYVAAQLARDFLYQQMVCMLRRERIDALLLPGVGRSAPPIHVEGEAERTGQMNLQLTADVIRHQVLANLIGLPGIAVPVDYPDSQADRLADQNGAKPPLPVGVQLLASHWREDILIRIARLLYKPQRATTRFDPVEGLT